MKKNNYFRWLSGLLVFLMAFSSLPVGVFGPMKSVQAAEDGLSFDTAYLFSPPGPQTAAVSSSGNAYFRFPATAQRTWEISSTTSSSLFIYNKAKSQVTKCSSLYSSCKSISFVPSVTDDYYLLVAASAGNTIIKGIDGSTLDQAYSVVYNGHGTTSAVYTQPAGEVAYTKWQLKGGVTYHLAASGPGTPGTPGGLKVFDSAKTQVADSNGSTMLQFTPQADDFFYVQLQAGSSNGAYTLSVTQEGTTYNTALPYSAPGPQTGKVTGAGYTYYSVTLSAWRTFVFRAVGANALTLYDSTNKQVAKCSSGCTSLSYSPTVGGTYYYKVDGTPNTVLQLTSVDASVQAQAYDAVYTGVGEKNFSFGIPGGQTSYVKFQLKTGVTYQVSSTGTSTPGTLRLLTGDGILLGSTTGTSAVRYTPSSDGTFYAEVQAGYNSGTYTLNVAQDGTSTAAAFPYTPPGPQSGSITSAGFNYYSVPLAANRTVVFTAKGASYLRVFDVTGTQLGSCSCTVLSYKPTKDGTYYYKVEGNSGASLSLSSVDGTSIEQAYNTSYPGTGLQTYNYAQPAVSDAYYKISLKSGISYVLSATGTAPAGIVLYDPSQQEAGRASGTAPLIYTPVEDGTYYVKFTSGSTAGTYSLTVGPVGSTRSTAYPFTAPGPMGSKITSAGHTWFSAALTAGRTYVFHSTGTTYMEVHNAAGTQVNYCPSSCSSISYTPPATDTYYFRVTGSEGAALELTASDGSDFSTAYKTGYTGGGSGSSTYQQPAESTAVYQLKLLQGYQYNFTTSGPASLSELSVLGSNNIPITTTAGNGPIQLIPQTTDTYYVTMKTGTTGGSYKLTYSQQGSTMGTPFSFLPPGPQTNTITSEGYSWYSVSGLQAGRTFHFSATNATAIYVFDSTNRQLNYCNCQMLAYTPATAGTYYYRVSGTAGTSVTVASVDGTSSDSAYDTGYSGTGAVEITKSIPANSASYFRASVKANLIYVFSISGASPPSDLRLYDSSGQELAVATGGNSVTYTATVDGPLYLKVQTSTTGGSYKVTAAQQGTTAATSYPFTPPGPQTGIITSMGYSWFSASLPAGRTVVFSATGATALYAYDASNNLLAQCTSNCGSLSLTPQTANKYYYKVSAPAGATTELHMTDGATPATAHKTTYSGKGTGTGSATQPKWSDAYFTVNLFGGIAYVVSGSGSSLSGIDVYDSSFTKLGNASGTGMFVFTPVADGTYYLNVLSSVYDGTNSFQISPFGSRKDAAYSYSAPGTVTEKITSLGYTWFKSEFVADRTLELTVQNASSAKVYDSTNKLVAECSTCQGLRIVNPGVNPHYIQVTGAEGTLITLLSVDGSSFDSAYQTKYTGSGRAALVSRQPGYEGSYYKVALKADTSYYISTDSTRSYSGIKVYDQNRELIRDQETTKMLFTPTYSGVFYVELYGISDGNYSFTIEQQGSSAESAYTFTTPGPTTVRLTENGAYLAIYLAENRTIYSLADNNNNGASFGTTGTSYIWFPKGGWTTLHVGGPEGSLRTIFTMDGSSISAAYRFYNDIGFWQGGYKGLGSYEAYAHQPANSEAYHQLQLLGGNSYVISSGRFTENGGFSHPSSLTLYDESGRELEKVETSGKIMYNIAETGAYYLKIRSVDAGNHDYRVIQVGTTDSTAFRAQVGLQKTKVIDGGFSKYAVPIKGYRTYQHWSYPEGTDPGDVTRLNTFYQYKQFTDGHLFTGVSGNPRDTVNLHVVDGLSMDNAYRSGDSPIRGTKYFKNYQQRLSSAYRQISLDQDTRYFLSVNGPSTPTGLVLYDKQRQEINRADGNNAIDFTPPDEGTFLVDMQSGTESGEYELKAYGITARIDSEDGRELIGWSENLISGTVRSTNLDHWTLSYGWGAKPSEWIPLQSGTNEVLYDSELYRWRTGTLPAGIYTLRLDVYDKDGNSHSDKVVTTLDGGSAVKLLDPADSDLGPDSVRVSWEMDDDYVKDVELHQSTGAADFEPDTNTFVVSLGTTERDYLVTDLEPGQTYRFKMRYTFGNGVRTSNVITVQTPQLPPSPTASERVTSYTYDEVGNVQTFTDARGHVTEYDYDALNRLTDIDFADGTHIDRTYDDMNRLKSVTNGIGGTTQYTYDELGRLRFVTDPDGGVVETKYDALNRPVEYIDPKGQKTGVSYDTAARTMTVTDPLGHTTVTAHDGNGNKTQVTDGNGNTTSYLYDAANRLQEQSNALGETTKYQYDLNGNRTGMILPDESVFNYNYNGRNQLLSSTDPTGAVTSLGYNSKGQLESVKDAKENVTTYGYSTLGDLTSVTDPFGYKVTYTYDANGNPLTMTKRDGKIIEYSYDKRDQLMTITAPGLESIGFGYDGAGNRTTMTDGNGTTVYEYTAGGRLDYLIAPDGKRISYTYDPAGNLKTLTDYQNQTSTYLYDEANRLWRVIDADGNVTEHKYDDGGRLDKKLLPGGTVIDYGYDNADRMNSVTGTASSGDVLYSVDYTRYNTGNVKTRTDSNGAVTYTYDKAQRLEGYRLSDGTAVSYLYDKAGNRETETIEKNGVNTKQVGYSYDSANRLLHTTETTTEGIIGKDFSYDKNGNLLTDGVNEYTYDPLDRLLTMTGGENAFYRYNGDGLRTEATINGETIRYYWDRDQISLETDQSGKMIANNQYGLDRIARILGPGSKTYREDGNNRAYYLTDAHQDTVGLVDGLGEILNSYEYDPWGQVIKSNGAFDNPFRYTGEYQDPTGAYYLRSRYYSPGTARFLSEDTYKGDAMDPLSLNLYTYVKNDPVNYNDPSGHLPILIIPIAELLASEATIFLTSSAVGVSLFANQVEQLNKPEATAWDWVSTGADVLPTGRLGTTVASWIGKTDLAKSVMKWVDDTIFCRIFNDSISYGGALDKLVPGNGSYSYARGKNSSNSDIGNNRSAFEGSGKYEQVLGRVQTYEQARNKALELVGDLGPESRPFIGSLQSSKGYGKVIGRQSADGKVRWRLDYDPEKGPHINIEDFRGGKKGNSKKYVIPFDGDESTFVSQLKHLNK